MSENSCQIVVGTAGHIDHGKSRLVMALTGTDPDRLPEEKARGMTIDLGFAHTVVDGCEVYFVDVPGHERFIRNMVAGATGIDLALLVVAADDSVMPQTREHAEVLSLLGVPRCAVVITKTDLVDDAWADQVADEAGGLLRQVGIEPVACVRVSAVTGRGLDDLRRLIVAQAAELGSHTAEFSAQPAGLIAQSAEFSAQPAGLIAQPAGLIAQSAELSAHTAGLSAPRAAAGWFRMPIDRAFSVRGRGTVVTGTVTHGELAQDDELELWPVGIEKGLASSAAGSLRARRDANLAACTPRPVRVRGLQSHNEQRERSAGRLRLAVNVAPLELDDVARGCELATPGYLEPTLCMGAWLASMRVSKRGVQRPIRARLQLATTEALAQVRFAAPHCGDGVYRGFAQIRTQVPVVCAWRQRFILRDESGSKTLGGGMIVRCAARPWRLRANSHSGSRAGETPPGTPAGETPPGAPDARDPCGVLDGLSRLSGSDAAQRVEEVVRGRGWAPIAPRKLACQAGVNRDALQPIIAALTARQRLVSLDVRGGSDDEATVVHADVLSDAANSVEIRLKHHLGRAAGALGVPRSEWPGWMPRACPERLRNPLSEWLIASGHVLVSDGFVVPRGHKGALSAEDQALSDALLAEFLAAGFQPPAIDELRCRNGRNAARVAQLLRRAVAAGRLVSVADGLWLHSDRHRELVELVTSAIRDRGGLTVADIRTLLHSSRKYVVPIVEHLDAAGITRREGDRRVSGGKRGLR